MLTERQQLFTIRQAVLLLCADQERLKADIMSDEGAILEDIEYLKTRPRWRSIVAYPDIWFAVRKYRKKLRLYNKRVNVLQSFIQQVNQLREELESNAQFNQNFEDD